MRSRTEAPAAIIIDLEGADSLFTAIKNDGAYTATVAISCRRSHIDGDAGATSKLTHIVVGCRYRHGWSKIG